MTNNSAPVSSSSSTEEHASANDSPQPEAAATLRNGWREWRTPLALVVAGALVAGAIIYTGTTTSQRTAPLAGAGSLEDPSLQPVPELSDADWVRGNADAPIIIIEYSDFECPFCKRFHQTMQTLMETYGARGELAWVYRHFPLVQLHRKAVSAAVAAECAGRLGGNQTFWRFTDRYFEETPSNDQVDLALLTTLANELGLDRQAFDTCRRNPEVKARIDQQIAEALGAGARGTPFSVLVVQTGIPDAARKHMQDINRRFGQVFTVLSDTQVSIGGAVPAEALSPLIDALLSRS